MENKAYYDVEAISARYNICKNKAYEVMRCIRKHCGGGKLPRGRLLPIEVSSWEAETLKGEGGTHCAEL